MKTLEQNPFYVKALDFIKDNDLGAMPLGKHFIDGDNLWVNIVDSKLKTPTEATLEAHDKYIDIQIPLSCEEKFGVKPRSECTSPRGEMNTEKDIIFFDDKVEEIIARKPGEMVVFEPDTAHAPLIGEGMIHKAIFKVRVV
ncbi:MAG: YhcH/YjgK/YiaL family protein [Bacteroidales bacterium]|nr:YhcH/YjgK/YiaL family protein [Bacteroidales bacterium]